MNPTLTRLQKPKSLDLTNDSHQNQMDDEKTTIQLRKQYWEAGTAKMGDSPRQFEISKRTNSTSSSEDDKIPEIKDIYDQIYGNVQSKLAFYESKPGKKLFPSTKSACASPTTEGSMHFEDLQEDASLTLSSGSLSNSLDKSDHEIINEPSPDQTKRVMFSPVVDPSYIPPSPRAENNPPPTSPKFIIEPSSAESTPISSPVLEKPPHLDLLKSCVIECNKCDKTDFVNDRSEVLTEINANLKLELENVKHELKKQVARNNELNFEIANIEVALETYYKEAKNQKSTFSSIYSAMKQYVVDQKDESQEHYTFKRIKIIADYMESLKNKLEHQDRIIRGNFVENPYYTDLMTKHEAVLKQLDDLSKENQELRDAVQNKDAEELEIIKELNRQKFQLEHKAKEMEDYYRNELVVKETQIRSTEDEYKKQLVDYQVVLDRKDEEMVKMQKAYVAKINNYKQELVIVYRKWKDQKILINSNK